ncbi:addiction module antitoxin RelB [Clostridia bacterium]|nr:addiction module antitoxin RelB [Clostridia bacterium]
MATLTMRIDDVLKSEADELFRDIGMDITTAVRIFLKAAIDVDGFPFEIKRCKYNAETLEAMEDARLGRNLTGPFDTVEEAMKSMLED